MIKHYITRLIYKIFRRIKRYYLTRPVRLDTKIFFSLIQIADKIMSPRHKTSELVWKQLYFVRYGLDPLFNLISQKPVAVESHDHRWPRGTLLDNSVNRRFNIKLYDFFLQRRDLRVLDLGCSGGYFVRSFLEDGYLAIGLEGSDTSKRLRSGEWDTCPHHLFTCDITSPFLITDTVGVPVRFHCITQWEVLEHISEDKLNPLFENITRHLEDTGIFVCSIDTAPDGNPITGAIYHVTLRPKEWWLAKFEEAGLVPVLSHNFETFDYVRGNGTGFKDWDPADGEGFHLVLRKKVSFPS